MSGGGSAKTDKPDRELLLKLQEACKSYKTDDIDTLIKEIESYDYESGGDLVAWLRENVEQMNYSEIAERVGSMV